MNEKPGMLKSINPHDGTELSRWEEFSADQVEHAIAAVTAAQSSWSRMPVDERASGLTVLAKTLNDRKDELARLMTNEMGKPIKEAIGEVEKCAWVCEFYAEQAAQFLAPIPIATDSKRSEVVFRPLGNVLAIMPWNFPFWQAFRFAVPAIAAGNGVVLKHASNVTGCAMAIESVFAEAFPENLLRTLILSSSRVDKVIGHDDIAAVTFTGSTGAGRKVGMAAGAALKKAVLELGGSDPYIVLADADVAHAARTCANARLVNGGQSCIAAKRFIVDAKIHDRFVDALATAFREFKVGNPMQHDTGVGPLARPDLAQDLARQVNETVAAGARIILGGKSPGSGAYYEPTILVDVKPGMAAFDEELFGPVAPIVTCKDEDEAIALANQSEFGLGGAIFTADETKGWAIASELVQTGTMAVNGQVKSDPRLPFGGIKSSGYGRELGEFGIREFVNIKTVSQF